MLWLAASLCAAPPFIEDLIFDGNSSSFSLFSSSVPDSFNPLGSTSLEPVAGSPDAFPDGRPFGVNFVQASRLQAIIFDYDGTLVDSTSLYHPGWNLAGAQYQMAMDEVQYHRWNGLALKEMARNLLRAAKPGVAVDDLFVTAFVEQYVFKTTGHMMFAPPPKVISPVLEVARMAADMGVPIALVTSGSRQHLDAQLKQLGLDLLFNTLKNNIVTVATVKEGAPQLRAKPSPDLFLRAASLLSVDPKACRAYSYSENGMVAAYRAGMHVIDASYMRGYPRTDALAKAKLLDEAARNLLADESWWKTIEARTSPLEGGFSLGGGGGVDARRSGSLFVERTTDCYPVGTRPDLRLAEGRSHEKD